MNNKIKQATSNVMKKNQQYTVDTLGYPTKHWEMHNCEI